MSSVAPEGYFGFSLETLKDMGFCQAASLMKDTIELSS